MIHINPHVKRLITHEWMIQSDTPGDPSAPPSLSWGAMRDSMLAQEMLRFNDVNEPAIAVKNAHLLNKRTTAYGNTLYTGDWEVCSPTIPAGAEIIDGVWDNSYYERVFFDELTWLQAWDWDSMQFIQQTGPWYKSSIRYYYYYQFNVDEYLFTVYAYHRPLVGILPILASLLLMGTMMLGRVTPAPRPPRK